MPSIVFLGTGGDEFVVGKQLRASGGIIIKVSGCQLHIDPGPGSLVRAHQAGINLRENTAVLVSHSHINHCNDVNAVLSAMSRNCLDIKGVLVTNRTFAEGNDESGISPALSQFHRKCAERVIIAKPGGRIGIEDIEIRPLKAFHSDPNALGFRIITPDFTLSYTGDTSYSRELVAEYSRSDILIMNTVLASPEKGSSNLSIADAAKILEKVNPKLAVITHFGKKLVESGTLESARELQKLTGVQVLAATDGMSINPVSYSADAKQKTLGSFNPESKQKQG